MEQRHLEGLYFVSQDISKNQESLPRWNLADLYSSIEDEKISQDLKDAKDKAQEFSNSYKGLFVEADKWQASDLLKSIQDYEELTEILQKLGSYAGLFYYTNLKDSKAQQFNQKIQEKATEIASHLIFFTLDLNKIEDADLQNAYQTEKGLGRYKSWFDNLRAFRPHQLSPDLEKLCVGSLV
jgi:oligoendopeptidase F